MYFGSLTFNICLTLFQVADTLYLSGRVPSKTEKSTKTETYLCHRAKRPPPIGVFSGGDVLCYFQCTNIDISTGIHALCPRTHRLRTRITFYIAFVLV